MAALCHSAITRVLRFSGYRLGSQVAVSGRQLQLMHCAYLLSWSRDFITWLGTSNPWVLRSGSAGTGCLDANK